MKPHLPLAITLTILLASNLAHSQHTSSLSPADHQAVLLHSTTNPQPHNRHVDYGFNTSWPIHGPIYHLLASSMYIYQSSISPSIARSCPFRPSCSSYSKTLISDYGLLIGTICSADRIMRCNRIALASRASYSLIDPSDHYIHEDTHRYQLR